MIRLDMTRREFLRATGAMLGGTALGGGLPGEVRAAEEKWITLFDGKTREGWHNNPKRNAQEKRGTWGVGGGG